MTSATRVSAVLAALLATTFLVSCGGSRVAAPKTVKTATAPPKLPKLLDPAPAGSDLPQGDAIAMGLGAEGLAALVEGAEASETDALLVVKDGKVVVERSFRGFADPIQTRSITKIFTGIAIGLLLSEGKIASLDAPIFTWFPEWNEGLRAQVKLRHLLDHTSGIVHDEGDTVLHKQDDMVQWVRGHGVKTTPGKVYSYNNDAVQLLAGIVRQAAGESLEAYVARRVFAPLGIERWTWLTDKSGESYAYAALALTARDLARVGLMMLDSGRWHGAQIVPREWVEQATQPQGSGESSYGLLWEILVRTQVVADKASLARTSTGEFDAVGKLAPLAGRAFENGVAFWLEAGPLLSPRERAILSRRVAQGIYPFELTRTPIGFGHSGSFGQFLVVLPKERVVAVRLLREPKSKPAPFDFIGAVRACLPS